MGGLLRRTLQEVVKSGVVMFVPYSWSIHSSSSETWNAIWGTFGTWTTADTIGMRREFYEYLVQQEIFFSLLAILPLLLYSIIYGEKLTNRGSISIAGISVFLSLLVTQLAIYTRVVPSVVSLAIFIFVFWPIIRNSWPAPLRNEEPEKEQGLLQKIRKLQRENIPMDAATYVWVGMVVFPAFLGVIIQSSQYHYHIDIQLLGGLSTFVYDYSQYLPIGNNPLSINSAFGFMTATHVLIGLLFWIFNLLLGVTTLRCILGKATKKPVYVLTALWILATVIPFIITISIGVGYLIPLPFYPILMLLFTKYMHAPTHYTLVSDETIDVFGETIESSSTIGERGVEENHSDSETESVEDSEIAQN